MDSPKHVCACSSQRDEDPLAQLWWQKFRESCRSCAAYSACVGLHSFAQMRQLFCKKHSQYQHSYIFCTIIKEKGFPFKTKPSIISSYLQNEWIFKQTKLSLSLGADLAYLIANVASSSVGTFKNTFIVKFLYKQKV